MTIERDFTPPELAKLKGVHAEKILAWIRSGELRATNYATHRSGRPRWRIKLEDWIAFEEGRGNKAKPKAARRRRKTRPTSPNTFREPYGTHRQENPSPGCKREATRRGKCANCYASLRRLVIAGRTTWKKLVAKGHCSEARQRDPHAAYGRQVLQDVSPTPPAEGHAMSDRDQPAQLARVKENIAATVLRFVRQRWYAGQTSFYMRKPARLHPRADGDGPRLARSHPPPTAAGTADRLQGPEPRRLALRNRQPRPAAGQPGAALAAGHGPRKPVEMNRASEIIPCETCRRPMKSYAYNRAAGAGELAGKLVLKARERTGIPKTRLHNLWCSMKTRCTTKHRPFL